MYLLFLLGFCGRLFLGMHYLMSFLVLQSRKRELVNLLLLSFGCLVTVNALWTFLTVPIIFEPVKN